VPPAFQSRVLSSLLLVAAIHATAFAGAVKSSGSWFARSWESDEGLPDNNVVGVAQTADGFLWAATPGGLVRFDGARFQEFSPAAIPGVPNRVVRALHLDRRDRLWLGMDRGALVCLEGKSAIVFGVADGLPDRIISQILVDKSDRVWIAYESGELFLINDGRPARFGAAEGLSDEGRLSIALDHHGEVWLAKGGSVGTIRAGHFEKRRDFEDPPVSLRNARHGGIWICAGSQLMKVDDSCKSVERRTLSAQFNNAEIAAMFEDRVGAVWIGTRSRGLFRADESTCEQIDTSHRQILALIEDREGNIWAGTGGGGLNRLRQRRVELHSVESGLPFEAVQSVCEDSEGKLWAATQNGKLAQKIDDKWVALSPADGWPGGHAMCVAAGQDSAVWIGLRTDGLCRLRNGELSRWRKEEGLAGNAIRSLLVASNGDLWIGTDGPSEVQRFREGKFELFRAPQSPRIIRAMAEDPKGVIWIGTSDGQLLRLEGNELVNDPAATAGRPLSIRALHASADGTLWIGYAGAGLGVLRDGKYARITTTQGLPENYVSQIVSDGYGWLWMGGNRGLFRVAERDVDDWLDGAVDRIRPFVYGRGEGLSSVQASFDSFPGALRSRSGQLWIPLRKGLAVIRPSAVAQKAEPARIIMERVLVDEQIAALYDSQPALRDQSLVKFADLRQSADGLQVPPNHRKLDFNFTSPSFAAPENLHFQYRLKGYETEWTEAGPERKAGYPRLPAGTYEFQVRSGINGSGLGENQSALAVIVAPFYWQTWWFRAASLAAFALLLGGSVRYWSVRRMTARMRQLEYEASLERERARIAKDIHDDLGANLTQIALLSELAQQDSSTAPKATERIEKISTTARQVIKSLDEIVWAVNPGNDSLAHLIDYSAQFALDYLRLANIRCRLDLPETPPHHTFSTDVRHDVFLVIKEAVHNVVKHSQATEVWLRIAIEPDRLRVTIQDNGFGFDPIARSDAGNGLNNMEKRIQEIGGQYHLKSEAGEGTTIIFSTPLQRKTH
jgi:signal transduction histidine kinase/ligand-binding sensor domain-containing protein